MNKKNELRCCLGCGRDTTSASGFCSECALHRKNHSFLNRQTALEHADRKNLPKRPKGIYLPQEDSYDENAKS